MAAVQNSTMWIIDLNADENSCKEVCSNMYTASTSCWGVMTYDGNSSTCSLVMAKEVPLLQPSPGVSLYMKDCMKGSNIKTRHNVSVSFRYLILTLKICL